MLLKKYVSHEKTPVGYVVHGDQADILLAFLSDDVIRVRVSFSREFPEQSYALVTTAWEDRLDPLFEGERQRVQPLDIPCEESEAALAFRTATLKLVMERSRCPSPSIRPRAGVFTGTWPSGPLRSTSWAASATTPAWTARRTISSASAKRPGTWTKRAAACA